MTNIFLRTTSAIEGRNGWLSQIHFSGRGLTTKRIKSQTAIHNYYLKRKDGTTACERLSKIKPTDLFDFIMGNIGELPALRAMESRRRGRVARGRRRVLGERSDERPFSGGIGL